jgi:hypothetical protein
MSKRSRIGNVDKNQTLLGSFFKPPAASSSAANVRNPGQFNSATQPLSVRPTLPLSEQITQYGAENSSVSRALDADLNEKTHSLHAVKSMLQVALLVFFIHFCF